MQARRGVVGFWTDWMVATGKAGRIAPQPRLKRWERSERWHGRRGWHGGKVGAVARSERWHGLAFLRHTRTLQPIAFLKTGMWWEAVAHRER
jgi:hypothetical protein